MRAVLIDPEDRSVTETEVNFDGACALSRALVLPRGSKIVTPVVNGQTGDALHVARPGRGPSWEFLGETYRGRGVIVSVYRERDAAVPLERVQGQVRF